MRFLYSGNQSIMGPRESSEWVSIAVFLRYKYKNVNKNEKYKHKTFLKMSISQWNNPSQRTLRTVCALAY